MPSKTKGLPTWGILLAGALAFAAFLFIRNRGQRTLLKAVLGQPGELITTAMGSANVSPRITRRTGRIRARNFKTEKVNATKDSLAFRFFLDGERADATVQLWMVRRASGQWEVVKSDTLFSK